MRLSVRRSWLRHPQFAKETVRRRPPPRRQLGHGRPRRAQARGVAGGEEGTEAEVGDGAPQEGRAVSRRPGQEGQGAPLPAAQEPGGPRRRAGGGARRAEAPGHGALARPHAEEGLRAVSRASAAEAPGLLDRWLSRACRCRMP